MGGVVTFLIPLNRFSTCSLVPRLWPEAIHQLHEQHEADPLWFLSEDMIGTAFVYVDIFSEHLAGLRNHIPYFEKLGGDLSAASCHCFRSPHGENDGGYAVSDYRAVNRIRNHEDLSQLAETELRERGISLVLDFVFNHTLDEHAWHKKPRPAIQSFWIIIFTFTYPLVDRFQDS